MLDMYNTMSDFRSKDYDTAVLPVGALEQHGNHLPIGTDTIIGNVLARRIAKNLDASLLPSLGITSSIEHRKGEGTVYLKAETLSLVIRDIAESLNYSGIENLIIVNAHGGNWILKPAVRQINRDLEPFTSYLVSPGSGIGDRGSEIMEHGKNDIHAGEFETSLMLHLYPEYVQDVVFTEDKKFVPQAYMDYFDVMEITESGHWGFPEAATAEKGKKMMDLVVEGALDYLQKIQLKKNEMKKNGHNH